MKKIVSFIFKAYQNPRLFIQLVAVKFRQLLTLSILVILLVTTFLTFSSQRTLNQINQSFSGALNYLPNYEYKNGQLDLANGEKPLYYQSRYFQLVIDDTIQTNGKLENIQLDEDKLNSLKEPSLISLYLFQDQAYAQVVGNNYQLNPQENDQILSRPSLITYLTVFEKQTWLIFLTQWIVLFVITIGTYWFQQLLYATLLSSFNRQLAMPLDFKQRIKLSIGLSALPMIVISLIQIFYPGFGGILLTGCIVFFTFHHAIKQHTFFVQKMFQKFSTTQDQKDLETNNKYEELDYMDEPITPEQNKQINHLLDQVKKEVGMSSEDLPSDAIQTDLSVNSENSENKQVTNPTDSQAQQHNKSNQQSDNKREDLPNEKQN